MKTNIKFKETLSIGFMLFAIFFGAGNVIFPPFLGMQSGENVWVSVIGFIIADVGLSLICTIAVAISGENFENIAARVSPKFATIFSILVYMMLGPLCAIPRIGAVSASLSIIPLVGDSPLSLYFSVGFIAIFFIATYLLAANPGKLLDFIGKIITPVMLILIVVIIIRAIVNPIGTFANPVGQYATSPFFKGFIEGYQTLDAVGALVIALVVISSIKQLGVTESKDVVRITIKSGIIASICLGLVYFGLGYLGATCGSLNGTFKDGGDLLVAAMLNLFGKPGLILLGFVVTMACLTTSVGLSSSFAEYFSKFFKDEKSGYNIVLLLLCAFSFILSNLGLSTILKVSLPALLIIYPITITLIALVFVDKLIHLKRPIFVSAIVFALLFGVLQVCNDFNLTLGVVSSVYKKIPLVSLGLGWIIPTIAGGLIGTLIPAKKQ
ncbi:branched-chain amino acid:cation transporter, LIVCS family [Hathewaya proteolytica DSM 3090]|uniref:Branched-chain amino acid transport system carrier protein n=1 Tax=Hathewaya proteolytica DSM 3090 TaxID=1121331 RepID=A0A1M6MGI3_9CLOT|nr:branched-chain amino acid transport system II carrier protein [Hathewaya proteolytica]SHJ82575.1 branched-chain amino acid:cation transporter, LIVCS family [Hathewaya proteolytica DSM 3090]